MPRSLTEIAFRVKQEVQNARLFLAPPSPALTAEWPLKGLPDPAATCESLRGSAFEADVIRIAEQVLEHRFPVLGYTLDTGPEIDWRRDYVHGLSSAARYFRFVPYLDFSRVGDHKIIWELNRHQHLVALAMAWRFTGREDFAGEIHRQIESWLRANPFLRGINWTSALEVAFRAMSWVWTYHLAGDTLKGRLRGDYLTALYRHACYLEPNLSWYFSPNTHLLGEAVALHAIATLFPSFPNSGRRRREAHDAVLRQMDAQVREDGSHFEQSSYYHVYALDMFLFHAVLAAAPESYREKLARMADYLVALHGPARRLPFLGDDDGGRWFHPYGERDRFGRATLATCSRMLAPHAWPHEPMDLHEQAAWWSGAAESLGWGQERPSHGSRLFAEAGVAIMRADDVHLIVDAGPFGPWSGGHSHADTLSIVARIGLEDVLVDAGTYTYVSDAAARDWFRGSAAHNTIRVDGAGQAEPAGSFAWKSKPRVELLSWESSADRDHLDAAVETQHFTHRRKVIFFKQHRVAFVGDEVRSAGPPGEHSIECFWHLGDASVAPRLIFPEGRQAVVEEGGEHGWRSPVLGLKKPVPVVISRERRSLPARFWTVLDFSSQPGSAVRATPEECSYRGLVAVW